MVTNDEYTLVVEPDQVSSPWSGRATAYVVAASGRLYSMAHHSPSVFGSGKKGGLLALSLASIDTEKCGSQVV
jgi:hypothetical protein